VLCAEIHIKGAWKALIAHKSLMLMYHIRICEPRCMWISRNLARVHAYRSTSGSIGTHVTHCWILMDTGMKATDSRKPPPLPAW